MTRKDYELIATTLRGVYMNRDTPAGKFAVEEVINELSNELAADNSRFDAIRFKKACGIGARAD